MAIDRSVKLGIISSLIATFVFIYFLEPILHLMTFALFNVFGSLARFYTDTLFEHAALLAPPDPALNLLALTLGVLSGACVGATVGASLATSQRIKVALKEGSDRLRIAIRVIHVGAYVLSFFFVVFFFLEIYSVTFELGVVTSFNQHLVAIGPYVSDQEEKVFRSRWTQMTSERDYRALYSDLERIAATNGVRLPENKIFSNTSLQF